MVEVLAAGVKSADPSGGQARARLVREVGLGHSGRRAAVCSDGRRQSDRQRPMRAADLEVELGPALLQAEQAARRSLDVEHDDVVLEGRRGLCDKGGGSRDRVSDSQGKSR